MIKILHCFLVFFTFNSINAQVFSEDFSEASGVANSFSLDGWNQTRDTNDSFEDGFSVDSGGAWIADGFNNDGTTGAMRINMTNNVKRDWLTAPSVDLSTTPSTGSYTVEWKMAFTPNNGETFQTLNSGDQIRLLVSIDGGVTYSSLALYDSSTTIPQWGETFSVELSDPSYFVSDVRFAFYAFESNTTVNATNVFIDDFQITDYSSLSTTDITISQGVDIYPNPTLDNLNVKNVSLSEVQLFTLLGQKVPVDFNESTIYTSKLTTGTYILKLTDEKGYTYTSKFIKK